MYKIGDKVKIVKPFPYINLTGKVGIVVEVSSFRKPVFYIEVEGIKTACLPEYVTKID
jgi:hypothetical protein